ncbi:MAG: T9SS type A sorting domain-containing protein [Ignavibacteriales bacterium]|nr:T9SS type A sorting domain-containing protein [Ignavibacteriales bacterium]
MKNSRAFISALSLAFVIVSWSQAQTQYALDRSTFGTAGGEILGGGYRLAGTVGQPAVGLASQSAMTHMAGFWCQAGSTVITPPSPPTLSYPADRSQSVPVTNTLSWFKSAGATSYRLQVSIAADFSSTVVDNATITDTLKTIGLLLNSTTYYWRVSATSGTGTSAYSIAWAFTTVGGATLGGSLAVSDGAGGTQILQFGIDPSASDGIDVSLGEVEQAPIPPSGIFDARFVGDDIGVNLGQGLRKDYRQGSLTATAVKIHEIRYQVGSGTSITINWNFTGSALTISGTLQDLVTGSIVNVSMSGTGSYTVTNPGSISKLKMTVSYGITTKDVTVNSGWNIVSVPYQATDMSVSALFPDASPPAYGFNNGYSSATTLSPGKGYWLKFPAPRTYRLVGTTIRPSTIAVNAGWNMIGALDCEATTSSVTSTPLGIVSSPYYGYSNGYTTATMLNSGKGYWVKASQAGTLNLQSAGANVEGDRIASTSSSAVSRIAIQIEDNSGRTGTLYLSEGRGGEELPPAPPVGVFDVRFSSNAIMEALGLDHHKIRLNSVDYPITLTAKGVEGQEMWINDDMGGSIVNERLQEGKTIVIHQKLSALVLSERRDALPEKFELFQNHPNPFNPSTTIRYALPEGGKVRLVVYNVLGEVVAELVHGEQEAGQHQVQFNAVNLSSGVYLYRLETGTFVSVRKLVVIR